MSRNGSGTYNPPSGSWNPSIDGNSATTADWNSLLSDLASALTQSVSSDGQTQMTGNLPMGGNKLTNLAVGTANTDSVRLSQLFSQGTETDLASAATTDIGAVNSNFVRITGTTTITSLGTNYNGPKFVLFSGALTLTHNATTLIIPGGSNITTAAGDYAVFVPTGNPSSGWRCGGYIKANGGSINGATAGAITSSGLTMATSRVLGRDTASTGAVEELTLTEVLDLVGSAAQGDILYRGASAWTRLGAGTSGQYLQTQGTGANPQWSSVSANLKAFVNFNGTGTVAINSSMNVTSITDNGTGDYTVNFTSALADANYATTLGYTPDVNTFGVSIRGGFVVAQTSSTCQIRTGAGNPIAAADFPMVSASFFR